MSGCACIVARIWCVWTHMLIGMCLRSPLLLLAFSWTDPEHRQMCLYFFTLDSKADDVRAADFIKRR